MTASSTTHKSQAASIIRVSPAIKDILDRILIDANTKDIGSKVKPEHVLTLAFSLIKKEHIEELKSRSLTNADKLKLRYREHVKNNGPMSEDDFLGQVLRDGLKI